MQDSEKIYRIELTNEEYEFLENLKTEFCNKLSKMNDEERAEYFSRNFCKECIEFVEKAELSSSAIPQWSADCKKLYRLSLAKANLAILKALGVPEKNIAVCNDCTCCTTFADNTENSEKNAKSSHIYGSFRRQTAFLPENIKIEERWKHFTVQAAFCGYLF